MIYNRRSPAILWNMWRYVVVCLILLAGAKLMPSETAENQDAPKLGEVLLPKIALDSTRLLYAKGDYVILWDIPKEKEIQRFRGHTEVVKAVAFHPDGKHIASGGGRENDMASRSTDNSIRLWSIATGKEGKQFVGHEAYVHTVQFSPDGKRLLTAGNDATARLWDVATGKQLFVLSPVPFIYPSASFSQNGRIIFAITAWRKITIWDAETGKAMSTLEKNGINFNTMASRRGSMIVTGSDGSIRTWATMTGKVMETFVGHKNRVTGVRFTSDGQNIVSASDDGTIRLWNRKNGEEIRRFNHDGPVSQFVLSGDNKRIYAHSQLRKENI